VRFWKEYAAGVPKMKANAGMPEFAGTHPGNPAPWQNNSKLKKSGRYLSRPGEPRGY